MNLVWVTAQDAPALAAAHAQAFENPWDAQAFTDLLAGPGVYGALARDEARLGLILCRVVAGEREVLTVGVTPQARRRGGQSGGHRPLCGAGVLPGGGPAWLLPTQRRFGCGRFGVASRPYADAVLGLLCGP